MSKVILTIALIVLCIYCAVEIIKLAISFYWEVIKGVHRHKLTRGIGCRHKWGNSIQFVFDEGDGVIGYQERNDRTDCYVEGLAVFFDKRGMGLGTYMLDFVENYATEQGRTAVQLEVDKDNELAYDWYKRRGYVEIPVESEYTIWMEKTL